MGRRRRIGYGMESSGHDPLPIDDPGGRWSLRRRSYFSTRAYSRRFSTLYRVWGDEAGVEVRPVTLPDLLIYYLLNVADDADEAAKRRIDLEIARTRTA